MDAKERLQLQLLRIMENELSEEQLKHLKNSMQAVMYDYNIILIENTELANYEGTRTERLLRYYAMSKLASNTSKETVIQYIRVVKQLCDTVHKEMDEITKEDVRYFLIDYAKKNSIKDTTMDSKRRYLSSVYGYLQANDMITKNPMIAVEPIKCQKRIKKPLSEEEVERLRLGCKDARDRAILIFMLETGVRVSELSKLNLFDVDFQKREVKVLGKGNKERFVYFTGKSTVALMEYFKGRSDMDRSTIMFPTADMPLFTSVKQPYNRLHKNAIEAIIKRIGATSGVTRVHCHLLRATFATSLARKGVAIDKIAKLLGHANLHTIDRYVLIATDELKEAIARVGSAA